MYWKRDSRRWAESLAIYIYIGRVLSELQMQFEFNASFLQRACTSLFFPSLIEREFVRNESCSDFTFFAIASLVWNAIKSGVIRVVAWIYARFGKRKKKKEKIGSWFTSKKGSDFTRVDTRRTCVVLREKSTQSRRCVSLSERCTHDLPDAFHARHFSRVCGNGGAYVDVHVSRVSVKHVTVMGSDAMGLPAEFAWFSAYETA